jgi:WD40 repeat protein
METIKVLLFAANPHGTTPLDLAREFRAIDEEVRMGPFRHALELILVPGTRPKDLLRQLNENQPQVVHFSSHGELDHLVLESGDEEVEGPGHLGAGTRSAQGRDMQPAGPDTLDTASADPGGPQRVSKSALVNVLRACDEGNLRLVVLNACQSRSQAEALTAVVPCVVSMNRTITDRAAIQFAASFYGALAFGRSVQNAFEQGVARLSAEGSGEVDTPELLVRAGVDASRVVLVGSKPSPPPTPAAEAPFLVPFPRNGDFVGRDGDLARLHACLSGTFAGPVGIRPAGLTGMGGIGKTQLAVEYVHRHRADYPDGIFWIDAASPLAKGFARLATDPRLRWAEADRPRDEQIRAAFAALNGRPQSLLVLDNLPDPAAIAVHLLPDGVPEHLRCRLLFTTRRHDLGRFAGVEVTVLPEEPALRLLLRHPARQAAIDPGHPDHEHARAIARMLGRLPLALELAGAYLGKYSGDVSLASYREGLKSEGALATLDADAAELSEADLRRVHDPAVAATIREQWDALKDESARRLLRVASLFPESSALSIARLGLLAGLSDEARPGRRSPLRRAVQHLHDACLVERLEAEQVRLHPLIHEFATSPTLAEQLEAFRAECLARAAAALESFPTLEVLDVHRGVDAVQEDLISILELCPPSASDLSARVQAVLRLLQREANNLRVADQNSLPTLFVQQIRNRALLMDLDSLKSSAEERLTALGRPHFRLLWKTSHESPALIRTLIGHRWGVTALALTSDGRHALSASFDGTLKLWDLRTGRPRQTFDVSEDGVIAVAVTPHGRCGITNSLVGTLKLWDLGAGQLLRSLVAHEAMVTAVAVTRDGRSAITGSKDGTLKLWDLATYRLLHTFAGHTAEVAAVAVTPDGHRALSASHDGSLRLWDLGTGQLLRAWVGHGSWETAEPIGLSNRGRRSRVYTTDWVTAVAMSPDGRSAVSGSSDCTIRLWDLSTGELLRSFFGHGAEVIAVAVTPDGRKVVSSSCDRTLRLWDLTNGQLLHTLTGHEGWVSAVAVTPDGRQALSGSHDGALALWDLDLRQSRPTLVGHDAEVTGLAVTPDGRQILSSSHDRTVKLWDLDTGQLRRTFTGHEDTVSAVAMTPDGRHSLSASHDGTLKLWDLATGQPLLTLAGHVAWVTSVAATPDGQYALSASYDGTLRLWDLRTGQLCQTFAGHDAVVTAVVACPDGQHALSGSEDGTLRLWDLATAQCRRIFSRHEDEVTAVAVSPDGRHALSAAGDGMLKLWDLATAQLQCTYAGHNSGVSAIAVCPDGRHALSASSDRTLRLLDLEERVFRACNLFETSLWTIALAPGGHTVVVGDQAGNIHHFQIYGT